MICLAYSCERYRHLGQPNRYACLHMHKPRAMPMPTHKCPDQKQPKNENNANSYIYTLSYYIVLTLNRTLSTRKRSRKRLFFKCSPFALQKDNFSHAKGVLLRSKTSPFEVQKDYIYNVIRNERCKVTNIMKITFKNMSKILALFQI